MLKRQKTRLTVLLMILSIMLLCFGLVACGTKSYTVTLDYNAEQGSVELSPKADDNKYEEGTELTVTVKPNSGYVLDTFKLSTEDGNATPDNAGKFVFKVQEDTTITVTFKQEPVVEKFTLTKNTPEHGTIDVSPSADAEGKYVKDTEITVTLTPEQGYVVDTFTVGGANKSSDLQNNIYKFNITENTAINATFKSSSPEPVEKRFTVTKNAPENGTITVSPDAGTDGKYAENAEITVTLAPAANYEVDTFTVGGTDKKAELNNNVYKFNITENTAINATFKAVEKRYSVTKNTPEHGTITVSPDAGTDGKYAENAEITVTLAPETDYEVATFTVDGVDKKAELQDNVYTFNIAANTEIEVTFSKIVKKFTVTVPASVENGEIKVEPESADNKYDEGTEITVTLIPEQGYEVATFTVGGLDKMSELDNNVYKFNIAENTEISASFKKSVPAVTAITLNQDTLDLLCNWFDETEGKRVFTLSVASVTPSELRAEDLEIEWEVDDDAYAEVDANGKVAAKAVGVTYVTATVKDTDVTATCSLSVTKHEHTNVTYSKKDDTQHTMTCNDCKYQEDEAHPMKLVSDGEEGHHSACSAEGCEYRTATVLHSELVLSSEGEGVDNTYHTMKCPDDCGYYVRKQHDWKANSSGAQQHWNECTVCHRESTHVNHTLKYRETEDGTQHVAYCEDSIGGTSIKCTYVSDPLEHSGTQCDVKEGDDVRHYKVCKDCNALYAPEEHSGDTISKEKVDETNHYKECTVCGKPYGAEAHSGTQITPKEGDADNHYTKCDACGTLYGKTPHTPGNYEIKDASYHTRSCTECNVPMSDEEHDKLGESGACTKCHYAPSAKHSLKYDANGYCDGTCALDSCNVNHLFAIEDKKGVQTLTLADGAADFLNSDIKIKLPESINGVQPTATGTPLQNNTHIVSVIIPEQYTSLTASSFSGCTGLKSALIYANVSKLGSQVFTGCINLEWIVLSSSITEIAAGVWGSSSKYQEPTNFKGIFSLGNSSSPLTITGSGAAKTFTDCANKYYYNEGGNHQWHYDIDGITPVVG